MVECVDENIGRLLDALDKLNLSQETIVLFLTDNGPNGDRYNGGMRGRKGSVHEGGIRVPLFVRWPGRIEAGIAIEPIAAHIDLFPTILAMCGLSIPAELELDGRNLWPLLQQNGTQWPDRNIFTARIRKDNPGPRRGSVRSQRWRAVLERDRWSLFDMQADPEQTTNVAGEYPAVTGQFAQAFELWLQDVTRAGLEYIPIPIGHPKRPESELPANEAFLNPAVGEGISYVSRPGYANAWIVDWTDIGAYPEWMVDVRTAGTYDVALLYNCREADVGAEVEVRIGDANARGVIQQPFYPAPYSSPDRLPQSPHYREKDWRKLPLGTVELTQGRAKLAIRALSRPGQEVMELKAVQLTPSAKPGETAR